MADFETIAFLSKHLAVGGPVEAYDKDQHDDFAFEHLQRMFPELDDSWIDKYRAVGLSEYAQSVTECGYSEYVPGREAPFDNVLAPTMAQVYPEDRGTNYAIREGSEVAQVLAGEGARR